MLLLQAATDCGGISTTVFIISLLATAIVVFGITYYFVNPASAPNTLVDCNATYGDSSQIGLNTSDARTMINAYANANIKSDTCSVWFSLKSIQRFACTIENNTKQYCNQNNKNGQNIDAGTLGIRFYFAKYPGDNPDKQNAFAATDQELQSYAKQYPNMTTLVMVPTYKPAGTNGINRDFDPTKGINGGLVDMAEVYSAGNSQQSTVFMMNHGNIVPPPWPVNAPNQPSVINSFYSTCGAYFLDNNVTG